MDADSWAALFSASKRHQSGLQIRSGADLQLTFDDFDVEEDLRAEFPCPFCSEDFDIVGLCCHIDDEHPIEAKNARRRRYRKGSHSTLSMLTRELREGHLQSLFVGSSCPVASSNTAADPLLSSFISSVPIVDVLAKPKSDSPAEETSDKQNIDEKEAERWPPALPDEEQEEMARRCSFMQELLLSTIFEDTL